MELEENPRILLQLLSTQQTNFEDIPQPPKLLWIISQINLGYDSLIQPTSFSIPHSIYLLNFCEMVNNFHEFLYRIFMSFPLALFTLAKEKCLRRNFALNFLCSQGPTHSSFRRFGEFPLFSANKVSTVFSELSTGRENVF
jgi:hypothetical protein